MTEQQQDPLDPQDPFTLEFIQMATRGKAFADFIAAIGAPVGLAAFLMGRVLDRRMITLPQVISAFEESLARFGWHPRSAAETSALVEFELL